MRRLHADLALLGSAVIWGLAFVFQKSAMQHVGPLLFLAARGTVAALALLPLALRERQRASCAAPRSLWTIATVAGCAFLGGGWLQQQGLETASVTNASFLTALYVVITPFVAWVWSGTAPGRAVWVAVLLSALGTWLLGGGSLGAFSFGDSLIALAAILWAVHVVICGSAARLQSPITFTAIQFGVLAVLASALAIGLEPIDAQGLVRALPDIAYVGLLSSALTFTLLTIALQYTSPSHAAVIVSSEVVVAALAGYLLLGERLASIGWIGAGLMLAAVLLVQVGPALMASLSRRSVTARAVLQRPHRPIKQSD